MVGAEGFEPPAPCSQSRCSTRLSYAPTHGHWGFYHYFFVPQSGKWELLPGPASGAIREVQLGAWKPASGDARVVCRVEARQPPWPGPALAGARPHLSRGGSTWASSFLSNSVMRHGMGAWPTSPKRSRRTLPMRLREGSSFTSRFISAGVARLPKQRAESAAVPRARLNLPPRVASSSARVVSEPQQSPTCASRRTAGGGPGRQASDPGDRQCRPSARAPQRRRLGRELCARRRARWPARYDAPRRPPV